MKIRLDAATSTTAARVTIQCPAKVNLFLEVLGKREDGFHEIETLMCPISLCDELTATLNGSGKITLAVETPDVGSQSTSKRQTADPAWDVPADESNLAFRAAEAVRLQLFRDSTDHQVSGSAAAAEHPGVELVLRKSIPAAAGLAGGSSNAAAVVTACLLLWAKWNRPVATELCQSLGSDVAFFLGSSSQIGMAMATGRGEVISPLSCKPPISLVLTHPPQGCSTPAIYAAMEPRDSVRNSRNIRTACETSAPGQLENIGAALFNALQSPASNVNRWIKTQLDLFESFGFQNTMMSGSGSACFGLCTESTASQFSVSPNENSQGLSEFRRAAKSVGIDRVFRAAAWYQPSIEAQVGQQRNWHARLLQ